MIYLKKYKVQINLDYRSFQSFDFTKNSLTFFKIIIKLIILKVKEQHIKMIQRLSQEFLLVKVFFLRISFFFTKEN